MNKVAVARELVAIAKELQAIEFPTQDAMKKYLKEHPDADKSKHRVVEQKGKAPAKKESPGKITKTEQLDVRKSTKDVLDKWKKELRDEGLKEAFESKKDLQDEIFQDVFDSLGDQFDVDINDNQQEIKKHFSLSRQVAKSIASKLWWK